jgi:hypothetical protein
MGIHYEDLTMQELFDLLNRALGVLSHVGAYHGVLLLRLFAIACVTWLALAELLPQ